MHVRYQHKFYNSKTIIGLVCLSNSVRSTYVLLMSIALLCSAEGGGVVCLVLYWLIDWLIDWDIIVVCYFSLFSSMNSRISLFFLYKFKNFSLFPVWIQEFLTVCSVCSALLRWVSERVNVWQRVREWTGDWMSEWIRERAWVREWMNERERE